MKVSQYRCLAKALTGESLQTGNISLRPWGAAQGRERRGPVWRSLNARPLGEGFDYGDYLDRAQQDFSIISDFFPLLQLTTLPTIKPTEIFISGRLIPHEVHKDCCPEAAIELCSLPILAFYPPDFPEREIYVVDRDNTIDWTKVPLKHRHYRLIGDRTVICTHHPAGEIEDITEDERSVAILTSAWKLLIQYRLYLLGEKWSLQGLDHGPKVLRQLKKLKRTGEI